MAIDNRIYQLITEQLIRELTDQELAELNDWAVRSEANELLLKDLENDELLARHLYEFHPENWRMRQERMAKRVFKVSTLPAVHRVHFLKTAWFRYAAAIILIFGTVAYFYTNQQKEKPLVTQPVPVKDILPGGNKALLTLADGSTILLDSVANGQLAIQHGSNVIKKGGQIIYDPNQQGTTAVTYNTMSTPRGGTYQLTLPDGTKVWLNAASSITFPTAFTQKQRIVNITGEVYFEVTKNKEKPFIVKTTSDNITVLGTSFNVNRYSDELTSKTSLVEGSIKISDVILTPGEAYINGKVAATNLEQDVAWKNGIFNFSGAELPVVLRQLSRWYEIEVRYEGKGTSQRIIGKLSRNLPLSEVLDALQVLNVKFRMEGKTLIVE